MHIALHFTSTYQHIKKCFVDLQMHKWSRIQVAGKAHGWAFERNGDEKGVVEACADSSAGQDKTTAYVKVGLKDLLGELSVLHIASGTNYPCHLSAEDRRIQL